MRKLAFAKQHDCLRCERANILRRVHFFTIYRETPSVLSGPERLLLAARQLTRDKSCSTTRERCFVCRGRQSTQIELPMTRMARPHLCTYALVAS